MGVVVSLINLQCLIEKKLPVSVLWEDTRERKLRTPVRFQSFSNILTRKKRFSLLDHHWKLSSIWANLQSMETRIESQETEVK